jgi:hypothetical protein
MNADLSKINVFEDWRGKYLMELLEMRRWITQSFSFLLENKSELLNFASIIDLC